MVVVSVPFLATGKIAPFETELKLYRTEKFAGLVFSIFTVEDVKFDLRFEAWKLLLLKT